jgi:hypothetical protein
MTATMPMTAHQRMAALSELLPDTGTSRRGWRAWLPRLSWHKPRGLEAVPERYRLQFLLLADAAMRGRPEAEVAAMAGQLAERTRPPKRLVAKLPDAAPLDGWFRDRTDQIRTTLAELLEGES